MKTTIEDKSFDKKPTIEETLDLAMDRMWRYHYPSDEQRQIAALRYIAGMECGQDVNYFLIRGI
ncbi:hypothetical protein ES708_00729 [subsurface metagenome]